MEEALKAHHRTEYTEDPEIIVSSPGVINLFGESTCYGETKIITQCLPQTMSCAISRRDDGLIKFFAADYTERKKSTVANLKFKKEDRWANLLKGVVAGLVNLGLELEGLNITVSGTVPASRGLNASAALAVSLTKAISDLYNFKLKDIQLAQVANYAEVNFLHDITSIVYPLSCLIAQKNEILVIDSHSLDVQRITWTGKEVSLYVIDSSVPPSDVSEELQLRHDECNEGVTVLHSKHPNRELRSLDPKEVRESLGIIGESIRKACIHVSTEHQIVSEASDCIMKEDFVELGKYLFRSHESIRDGFEASCPEIDWIVKRSQELPDILGARMIGKGFGGCLVMLVQNSMNDEVRQLLEEYERIFGFDYHVYPLIPSSVLESKKL